MWYRQRARSREATQPNARMRPARAPITEALEGRILFANRIWDGGAGVADPNWSNPSNWQDDVAPAAGDTLFFPATGVSQRTSVNDFNPGTQFLGINLDGSSPYSISGNGIALGGGGVNVFGNAAHTFNLPVAIGNLGTSFIVTLDASLAVSGPFTGAGALNKGGDGRLELTGGSPNFAGAVNVNAGSLRINNAQALGNNNGQTFVVDFASLIVGTGATGISEQLFIGGTGNSGQGALRAEGTATWAGAVQMTSSSTSVTVDSGDFTISGNVTGGPTGASVTKEGAGRLILSGGATGGAGLRVNAGTVRLSGPNPSLGATTVTSGAALEITGGRTASFSSLALNGNGGGNGALLNVSGNNTINGPVSLAASTTIGSSTSTLTLRGNIDTGNANPGRTLTLAGAGNITIGGTGTGAITGNGVLTKTGTGTLTLSGTGASTFTGATNVSQGALVARKPSALGATTTGTTVSSGASLRLDGNISFDAEPLTINGNGPGNSGALANLAGSNTYRGNITLGSGARIASSAGTLVVTGNIDTTANAHAFTVSGAGNVEFGGAGILSGAGRLNKEGTGMLILSGSAANTYSGLTEVFNGIIQIRKNGALGSTAAETVIAGPGTVQLFSSNNFNIIQGVTVAERIRISTGGFNGQGALHNASGTNTWSGPVEVVNPSAVGSASGLLVISGAISGNQPLSKFGSGGVALSGNNSSFTGRIAVQAGSLNVRSNTALGATGGNSDTQVASGATLVLGNSGFNGIGGVSIAGETLALQGGATLAASSALGGGASSWGGPVILNGLAARTINSASPLTISGVVSGTAALTKTGTRDLVLSANNTFTGATTVAAGRLLVNGTLNGAVTIASGAEVGGIGSIRTLTVQSGGVVNPGVNGPGILTISNGLTMNASSILRVELNGTTPGTQHDQLRVTGGNITLQSVTTRNGSVIRPRLEVALGFNPATGDQFRILDNAGTGTTTGRFSPVNITIGDEQLRVATQSNDVLLTTL